MCFTAVISVKSHSTQRGKLMPIAVNMLGNPVLVSAKFLPQVAQPRISGATPDPQHVETMSKDFSSVFGFESQKGKPGNRFRRILGLETML